MLYDCVRNEGNLFDTKPHKLFFTFNIHGRKCKTPLRLLRRTYLIAFEINLLCSVFYFLALCNERQSWLRLPEIMFKETL